MKGHSDKSTRPKRRRKPSFYILWGSGIILVMGFPAFYMYEHAVLAGYQIVQYPSAKKGDADAQYEMGQTYRISTTFLIPDKKKAFRWELLAAEQGHVEAMYLVANSYYMGNGTDLDLYAAIDWYHKAADQGHVFATEMLESAERRLKRAEDYRKNGDYDRARRLTGKRLIRQDKITK